MDSPKSRTWNRKVEYVVVRRDGVIRDDRQEGSSATTTLPTDQAWSRSYMKRDDEDDSDDEDDFGTIPTSTTSSYGPPTPV